MKKDWQYCNLEEVVSKESSNISLNKIENEDGIYPVFGAQGFVQNVSFYHQEKEYLSIIKDGAGIGRITKHPEKSSIVATMQYLLPKDGFDIDFIKYFLEGVDFIKYKNGSTIPHIYFKDYKFEQFPKISLTEQKRIVAILDQAFEAIDKVKANTEQNLKNAKELFQSYLQGVFENKGDDWEEKKLGDVCEVIAGQSPEGKYYNSEGKGLPFYQGKKEYGDKYIGEPRIWTTKITKEAEAEDILMSVRAPVGPVNFSTQKICIGRGLAAIRASKSIDKEFLFNFLINHENEIEGNAGAVFNSINKTQIENISIPLPPLTEQKAIVQRLDALRAETQRLEFIYRDKLLRLEELKKSILQKAFAGEL
jgi:type I restriction enzyme S subunit